MEGLFGRRRLVGGAFDFISEYKFLLKKSFFKINQFLIHVEFYANDINMNITLSPLLNYPPLL